MKQSNFYILLGLVSLMLIPSTGIVHAELSYEEKVSFVDAVEETMGHILAAKENILVGNHELAALHLTHPISELYGKFHDGLKNKHEMDKKVELVLFILKNTNTELSGEDFDSQAKVILEILNEAKSVLIQDNTLNDSEFKFYVISSLLNVSKSEYVLGMESGGGSLGIVEFQDSDAFVQRAKTMLYTIDDIDTSKKNTLLTELQELDLLILNRQPVDSVVTKIGKITKDLDVLIDSSFTTQTASDDIDKKSPIPSWVKSNADWWAEDLITDDAYISGMQYLIQEGILQI